MKQLDYAALVAAATAAVSVFLPWLEPFGTSSFGGYSSSFSLGKIPGIALGFGGLAVILALVGGLMAYKQYRWAFMAGVINLLDGLGYLLGWFNFNSAANYSFSSSFGRGGTSASMAPQIGLYLFVASSLVFVLLTLRYLKQEETEKINEFEN